MKKQELVVLVNPKLMYHLKLVLTLWLFPVSLLAGSYGVVRYYLSGIIYYILSFFLVGPLLFLILMIVLFSLGSFSFPKKGKAMMVLNQDGIWLARFGFIPWKEISEFGTCYVPSTPMEIIIIRVKDNKKISKQSSIAGKLDFFWARLMGHAPIKVAGLAIQNNEVIAFAKQFLNN